MSSVPAGLCDRSDRLRVGAARAAAGEAVIRSVAPRATIEQAKGALMLAYRLTPEAAFDMLSGTANTATASCTWSRPI